MKRLTQLIDNLVEAAQRYGWSSDQGSQEDAEIDEQALAKAEKALIKYLGRKLQLNPKK
jgi:hypothetical protein